MPLNLECQNKTKGMRSCFFVGVSIGGQKRLSVKGCYRSGLLLQFNSVESFSGQVIEKFGSMKQIVREVGADSSNSNELGFWNGFVSCEVDNLSILSVWVMFDFLIVLIVSQLL